MKHNVYLTLFGVFGAYIIGYGIARISVKDYITKKDKQPGQGWEYQLFLPAIKIEEALGFQKNIAQ